LAPYNLTTSAADFSVCQVSDYVTEDNNYAQQKINKQYTQRVAWYMMVATHKMPVSLGFVGFRKMF